MLHANVHLILAPFVLSAYPWLLRQQLLVGSFHAMQCSMAPLVSGQLLVHATVFGCNRHAERPGMTKRCTLRPTSLAFCPPSCTAPALLKGWDSVTQVTLCKHHALQCTQCRIVSSSPPSSSAGGVKRLGCISFLLI